MNEMLRPLSALALAALLAGPLGAQQRVRVERATPTSGWIGISFDVTRDRRGWDTQIRITDVHRDSPAEEAGLRPGDRLLAVNDLDEPSELRSLAERLRLRVGDRVRMVVERDGRRREFRLRAGARPRDFVVSERVRLSFEPDSLVENMVRAMDSLKLRIVEGRGPDARAIVATIGAGTDPGIATSVRAPSVFDGTPGGVRAPFEFFVFRGTDHDSLRREMEDVNGVVADLEGQLERRQRVLERRFGSVSPVRFAGDEEVRRIQREMDDAARRSTELSAAMAETARANAGLGYAWSDRDGADRPQALAPSDVEFRPLTPYLLGRNRVAGAEVIDLKPELASYFEGVDRGVLVVDVAPRTPAALSGIVPGDVITRMDQVVVRSVEDLRFGVSRADETLPLTLIRRGSSIQVLLRR